MSKSHRVTVNWIPSQEGGRKSLPSGKQYITTCRFQQDTDDTWYQEAWSMVLEFDTPPTQQGYSCIGKAHFLANNAPNNRLQPGSRFELYEGKRKVAKVEVLTVASNKSLSPFIPVENNIVHELTL